MAAEGCTCIIRATTFARAAHRYWLNTFPRVRAELGGWRRRAAQIPDPTLRNAALEALRTKSDDLEGAVAFSVFAPLQTRATVARAITAFQLAFDYLDNLAELPNDNPIRNGRTLNRALLVSFAPRTHHPDYYRHQCHRDDGGYLESLVNACQKAISMLPSYAAVLAPVQRAVLRIAIYQSLNHGDEHGSRAAFTDWAWSQVMPEIDMRWWEIGAAAGSQLTVHAMIAAAADPTMNPDRAIAIERAYFPWIGALSTLLDSLVDRHLDLVAGQRSLIDYYTSPTEISERFRTITLEARRSLDPLVDAENHVLILAAMAAFFHSSAKASTPDVALTTRAVLDTVGGWATPALAFFRTRQILAHKS